MTNTLARLMASAALVLVPALTLAAGLTPTTFVQADVEARDATLAGMQQRLTILQAGGTLQDEMAALESSQAAVTAAFARYGTTGAAHGAYAAAHGAEVQAWIDANPDWQMRYADLEARLQALSAEFDSIRGR